MRAIVMILGLALVAAVAPIAAQEQPPTLLPHVSASPIRKVDFGLKHALRQVNVAPTDVRRFVHAPVQHSSPLSVTRVLPTLPLPVDCAMVVKHTHPILSPARVITPPTHTKHQLKVITVPSCPVR